MLVDNKEKVIIHLVIIKLFKKEPEYNTKTKYSKEKDFSYILILRRKINN